MDDEVTALEKSLQEARIPERYRVAVVGRFKVGKSSFVNKLAQEALAGVETSHETGGKRVGKGDASNKEAIRHAMLCTTLLHHFHRKYADAAPAWRPCPDARKSTPRKFGAALDRKAISVYNCFKGDGANLFVRYLAPATRVVAGAKRFDRSGTTPQTL